MDQLETVRQFLGLPSLSQTAARLALWNAKTLSDALRSDGSPDVMADSLSTIVGDGVRLALRKALIGS